MKKSVIILYIFLFFNIAITCYLFLELRKSKSDIANIEYNLNRIDIDYLEKIQPKAETSSDCNSGGWLSQAFCDNDK